MPKLKWKRKHSSPNRDTCCTLGFCAFCGGMVQPSPLVQTMGRKTGALLTALRPRKRRPDAVIRECGKQ